MATRKKRTQGAGPPRVLLVDDHVLVREALVCLFSTEKDIAFSAHPGPARDLLSLAPGAQPDLLVVDIQMKQLNGLEFVRDLLARHPHLAVLVLTCLDEELYADLALRAGARGYLMKDQSAHVFMAAVRRVLSGGIAMSQPMMERLLARRYGSSRSRDGSAIDHLSGRELEVLQLIGQWKTTREIARELRISIKTIEYYRDQLKAKLGLKDRHQLTHYAVELIGAHTQSSPLP